LFSSSVIEAFFKDPSWKIRTVNRDPTKAECEALEVAKGVEVVKGSFENVESLITVFQGANVLFGLTDFWTPFFNPATPAKLAPDQLTDEYCYKLELQQGKYNADAVATIAESTLEPYVWSSLFYVKNRSKEKCIWVYHCRLESQGLRIYLRSASQLAKENLDCADRTLRRQWKSMGIKAHPKAEDVVYEMKNIAEVK
jgi:hypothetical protein